MSNPITPISQGKRKLYDELDIYRETYSKRERERQRERSPPAARQVNDVSGSTGIFVFSPFESTRLSRGYIRDNTPRSLAPSR